MIFQSRLLARVAVTAILVGTAGPAFADDATLAEIAALKAQLRRLEAKVEAQERRERQTQAAPRREVARQPPDRSAPMPPAGAKAVLASTKAAGPVEACKPGSLCLKGVTITPGGFFALESVFRSRAIGADVLTPFGAIPLANSRAGHAQELRLSARQSRVSALVEGDVDPATHLSGYGEFDFLGAAQTANANQSDSFTPRIRNLYAAVDQRDWGLHILAGQNWTLATTNIAGIVPRKEDIPLTIDPQFVPGFIWARQPQLRVVKDFGPELAVAASLENPQTTESGALPANFTYNQTDVAGGGFNGSNSVSLNHVPDLIAKVAWDPTLGGHKVHAEVFGLGRDFYGRSDGSNHDVFGGGGGGSLVVAAVPDVLDLKVSGAIGSGIGRYGAAQLPDITVSPTSDIKPIPETAILAGATWRALPELQFYAYAGLERASRQSLGSAGGVNYGYGNPLNSNAGCDVEGSTATCTGNNRTVRQATFGLWDTVFSGAYGQLRAGAQYSYTQREVFSAVEGGAPKADEHSIYTSLRYFPLP